MEPRTQSLYIELLWVTQLPHTSGTVFPNLQKFDFCSPDMTEAPRKRKKTDESENGTETPVVSVAEGQSDVVAAIEKLTEQIGLIADRRK